MPIDYRDPRYKENFDKKLRENQEKINQGVIDGRTYKAPTPYLSSGNVKWHRTNKGEIRICTASKKPCPYGDHVQTSGSEAAAVKAFEKKDNFYKSFSKKKIKLTKSFKAEHYISERLFLERLKGESVPDSIEVYEEFDTSDGVLIMEREIRAPNRDKEDPLYFREQPDWKITFKAHNGKEHTVYYETINQRDIENFLNGKGHGFMGTPMAEQRAVIMKDYEKEELVHNVLERYNAVELTSKISPNPTRRSPNNLTNYWLTFNQFSDSISGKIDYNTTSFDPDFFPILVGSRTISSQDITMSNNSAGLGVAEWKLRFIDDKSYLTVTGSRGDSYTFEVKSEKEASDFMNRFYDLRVTPKRSKKKNQKNRVQEAKKRNIEFVLKSLRENTEAFENAKKHAEVKEASNNHHTHLIDYRKYGADGAQPLPIPQKKRSFFGRR